MDNLIRIKQIIDHVTKEPYYPTSHAIAVGYTNANGECTTVQDALDTLRNAFETLNKFYLTLGYNSDQAFPGNEGKALQDQFASLTVDNALSLESTKPVQNKVITEAVNQLFSCITDRVCYCTPRDVHYIKYQVIDSPDINGEITYSHI